MADVPNAARPLRVLIADDHAFFRSMLAALVRHCPGCEVVGEAADGSEAVEHALRSRPDVVLMDLNMPLMDGVAAIRAIKAERPEVRVVGLSMHDGDFGAEVMLEAGAETYVCKGGRTEDLLAAVRGDGRRRAGPAVSD